MPTVEFHFLGPLDIRCDGQPLPQPATLKSQSMLAYLVLHRDRPHPRERLAATAGQDGATRSWNRPGQRVRNPALRRWGCGERPSARGEFGG
jgi:hypothetical protein